MNINYDKYSEVHKQLYHSCGLSFHKALRAPYCCPECFLLKVFPWFIFMSWIIFMYFHNCNPITLISKEDGEQKKNKLSTGFYRLQIICKTPTFMILVLSDTLYVFLFWKASLLSDTLPYCYSKWLLRTLWLDPLALLLYFFTSTTTRSLDSQICAVCSVG